MKGGLSWCLGPMKLYFLSIKLLFEKTMHVEATFYFSLGNLCGNIVNHVCTSIEETNVGIHDFVILILVVCRGLQV
jgi:hypothetical protein